MKGKTVRFPVLGEIHQLAHAHGCRGRMATEKEIKSIGSRV